MSPTCDTGVIVPALTPWHPDHTGCVAAVRDVRRVPAPAIVEAFSVLTRLPPPHRISPALIAATAREHGLLLLSRDRRAVGTYEKLGVAHALV